MEEIHRDYNMTNAELMMFVSNLVHSLLRDAISFEAYGVSNADILALGSLGDTFETFPPDTFYKAEVTVTTQTKEDRGEELINDTRKITNRALAKWGENSGQYKKFGVKGLSGMSDKALLATARLVTMTATQYLAELADEGLTQQMIDDYVLLAQQYENDMNAVYNAVEIRDNKSRERALLGNDLYSYVSKYCLFGKTIWNKVDEAKYNDYVIYKTEGGMPGKVLDMDYDAGSGILNWSVPQSSDPIDKYELERSPDDDNWTPVYEGAENQALVVLLAGENYFRCRAHNKKGWGGWSDSLEVNVGGIDAPAWVNAVYSHIPPGGKVTEDQVEVTYANVPAATMYEIWRSVVPVGDPAGTFLKIAEEPGQMYLDFDLILDRRNYYFIISTNNGSRSVASVQAWDDIVN